MISRSYLRVDRYAHEIGIVNGKNERELKCYTIEFKEHDRVLNDSFPTTVVDIDSKEFEILKALSTALMEMGIFPESATQSELKATKYHLEDMRKLAMGNNK